MSAGIAIGRVTAGTSPRRRWGLALFVGAAVALVPLAVRLPPFALLLAPVPVVVIAVGYTRPVWAVYLLLGATPLTVGIARGSFVPLLRPHEALGLLLGVGVGLRALAQLRAGHRLPLRFTALDGAILAMAGTGSVLPLLWMPARGLTPTAEDLYYAATFWKFYALFLVIRASVRTERQVRRCLQVSIAAYVVVAVLAILQSLELAGAREFVSIVYPTGEHLAPTEGRGSATLGSSIVVGDTMAFHLAICLAWLLRERGHRLLLAGLAVLFFFGGICSGQFSGLIALGVAMVAIAALTGHVRRLFLAAVPVALVGAVALRPVLEARLARLDIATGLPASWLTRFDNLRLFVWPQVFAGHNWLFGVRPSSRIVADVAWGPYIFIESGHLWLLWTGGVPLFVAFLLFTWVAARTTGTVARGRGGSVGVTACAAFAGVLVVFVLMCFDPHISVRGTADLLFSLLALATAVGRGARGPDVAADAASGVDRPAS